MSFKYFHERLPWQPKLPCNFHKNFIYVIRTLSLIFLWKISFLAQRVHVSEILRHLSQCYPTHSRLVYDTTWTILAILYRKVPHMLPAKYQPNPPGGSGVEDSWRVFTIFRHGGHLEFRIKTIFAIFRSPCTWMLLMKFGHIWPCGFRGEVVWIWVDGRRTDDGGFPYYKLPRSLPLTGANKPLHYSKADTKIFTDGFRAKMRGAVFIPFLGWNTIKMPLNQRSFIHLYLVMHSAL